MTEQEMHDYNRKHAISPLSFASVCQTEFTIKLRYFMEEWLAKAYEAGYKNAKNGEL